MGGISKAGPRSAAPLRPGGAPIPALLQGAGRAGVLHPPRFARQGGPRARRATLRLEPLSAPAIEPLRPSANKLGAMALRLITAGESHGPGLTCIVEGLPAGLTLQASEDLNGDMARRQLGHGRGGRMKIERDSAEITGGVRHGRTLGGPVALQVANRDYANWEERMNPWPVEDGGRQRCTCRGPGHADLVGTQKYKQTDVRNILERASARETAARVAGGALCKAFLSALGVEVHSHVIQIASVHAPAAERELDARRTSRTWTTRPVRCLDADASKAMVQGDRPAAQGQRVARRRVRGAGLRPAAGPRLARLLGGAPGRAPGDGDLLDSGAEGRLDRRRLHRRRPAGLAGARRDLLRRASAATTARPTAPAASRAG